jgi:hypothetical protein
MCLRSLMVLFVTFGLLLGDTLAATFKASQWMGKSRHQLTGPFPGASNQISGWQGYPEAALFFNQRGRLCQFAVEFPRLSRQQEAVAMVTQVLGIDLSKAGAIVDTTAALRFENIDSRVKTVTLYKPQLGIPEFSEVTVTYWLAYQED